jgi:hypothetical protein
VGFASLSLHSDFMFRSGYSVNAPFAGVILWWTMEPGVNTPELNSLAQEAGDRVL